MRNWINNLNFLIILLDKDFFACYKLKSFNTKEVGNLDTMPFLCMKPLLKQKKEDGMKKLVIVAIAVLLALPVVSHAGSATSMWDLTIGGYVAVFAQWADQEQIAFGPGTNSTRRTGSAENRTDQFSNFAAQIDPRITFTIKGPDTWGAKSSATIQWDFSGMGTAANVGADNGEAKIRYAMMKFDWANDTILFGNWVQNYRDGSGGQPPPGVGTLVALPGMFGGPRETQLRWQHNFNKNFSTKLALVYPTLEGWKLNGFNGTNNTTNNSASDYTRSDLPFVSGQVRYNSDACGKIGNFNLVAGMSGVYGRKSMIRDAGAAQRYRYSQKQEDGWLGEAFVQVPIIPEKPNNKAMALLFYANAMAGQGLSPYSAQLFPAAYRRTNSILDTDNFSTPRGYAYEAGMMFWLTDKVWLSPSYNDMFTQVSNAWKNANPDSAYRTQNYNIFLAYAPNPALTMGIEYTRIVTQYARSANIPFTANFTGFTSKGVVNAVRVGAYYWF
jgi:hypothetical protein